MDRLSASGEPNRVLGGGLASGILSIAKGCRRCQRRSNSASGKTHTNRCRRRVSGTASLTAIAALATTAVPLVQPIIFLGHDGSLPWRASAGPERDRQHAGRSAYARRRLRGSVISQRYLTGNPLSFPCPSKIMLSNTTSALSIKRGCAPIRGLRSKSRPFVIVAKLSVPSPSATVLRRCLIPSLLRFLSAFPARLLWKRWSRGRSFTQRQCSSERSIISVGMKLERVHCVPILDGSVVT